MAESSANNDIFDVDRIRRLIELMKEHDLSEMDLRQEDMRIQLRRGANDPVVEAVARQPVIAAVPAAVAAEPAAAEPADDKNLSVITSPIVGTFYAAPDPDAAPYVKVGDHVGPETTVCIVEAMKVFNEIPAETSGKVVAILAKSGEPVEYGQPLFKVDPNG